MNIYLDESGELGFHPRSSKHYVIACVCTDNSKRIAKRFKKYAGFLIRNGWPKEIEPKAARVFNSPFDQEIPDTFKFKKNPYTVILDFLDRLVKMDFEIDTFVVRKAGIEKRLRTVPFGILHNYYARQILIPRIIQYDNVHLFVDQRSKERHAHLHFSAYIETEAFMTKGEHFPLQILHEDSQVVKGISVVDYISWSIFRLFESGDNRYFDVIRSKVVKLEKWFFK